jgi:hypothetical protein
MQTINQYQIHGEYPSTVKGSSGVYEFFQPPTYAGPYSSKPLFAFVGVPALLSAVSATGQLGVPAALDGQPFHVAASGNVFLAAGTTVEFRLSANTSSDLLQPVFVTVAQQSFTLSESTYYPWSMDVAMEGDSLSGIVQGSQSWLCNNTPVASTPLTNTLTGINFSSEYDEAEEGDGYYQIQNQGTPGCGFGLAVLFGTPTAGNIANMFQFALSA